MNDARVGEAKAGLYLGDITVSVSSLYHVRPVM